MPVFIPHAGRSRLLALAGCALLFLFCGVSLTAAPQHLSAFDKAQRLREALEGRSEHQRTRRDYERVMDAYRAVYHGDPASPKADASVAAVADLLAEEGRIFQDEKALRDAIGQYEFLRKQYPASRYRFSALLTEGEIYLRDLNDRDQAKASFQQFLKLYPQNAMANEARTELRGLRKPDAKAAPEVAAAKAGPKTKRNAVLAAAIQSQQGDAAPASTPANNTPPVAAPARTKTKAGAGEMAESDIPPAPVSTPVVPAPVQAQPELSKPSHLSDAVMTAPPPPRKGKLPLVTSIRHWSTPVYTRVAIDLQDEVQYEAVRVPNPDRIFFDLHGSRLSPELIGKSVEVVDDGFLKRVRAAQFSNDVTRIVLDVSDVSDYSAFFLPNPSRLIIDVHGRKSHTPPVYTAAAAPPPAPVASPSTTTKPTPPPVVQDHTTTAKSGVKSQTAKVSHQVIDDGEDASTPETAASGDPAALADVASLGQQPNRVRATKHPTTAPVAQSVADTTPAPAPAPQTNELVALNTPPATVTPQPHAGRSAKTARAPDTAPAEIHAAQPTADGQRSMVRALGLKINRIVIDAGHGGHDSGTLGPGGIEEKDVVLDVALRLGAMLKQKLGAEIIYTRDDDTFIPLETRTAIANKAQADLFISVHANSSQDSSARGVEVYYLNFTTSADALEVAARENAVSDQSIHQLSDLVKKITLQDKINESREFAADVDQSLYSGLQDGNPGLKDRGVKKAPFVVLIGANMPSVLAEISFLTNPEDAVELRQGAYRERIAESIYRGVARYVGSLSGVRVAQASSHSSSQ